MEKIRCVVGTMIVTAWVATGCGRDSQNESQLHTTAQELEFPAWCQDWQLQCPDGAGDTAQINKARAIMALLHTTLDGDSQLDLDRAKIEHPGLMATFEFLGMREEMEPLLQKLKDHGWNEARIQPRTHQMQLGFLNPQPLQTKSGLKWQPMEHLVLGTAADGQLQFEGLQLSSADGSRTDALRGTGPQDAQYAQLMGAEWQVKNVPPSFLPHELEIPNVDVGSPSTQQIAAALRPFTEWLLLGNQLAHVPMGAFDVLYREADILVADEAQRQQVRVFASALESVRAQSAAGDKLTFAAQQRANGKLACKMNAGKSIDIKFNRSFGLEEVRLLNNDAVQTRFYGIEVKSKIFGPITPKFSLKRVEIYADKAVIRDVPIIGSYTLRFSDLRKDSKQNAVECTN